MPDDRCYMQDAICQMPYARCHMPDAICQMPYARCHMPDAICQMPYARCHMQDVSCQMTDDITFLILYVNCPYKLSMKTQKMSIEQYRKIFPI